MFAGPVKSLAKLSAELAEASIKWTGKHLLNGWRVAMVEFDKSLGKNVVEMVDTNGIVHKMSVDEFVVKFGDDVVQNSGNGAKSIKNLVNLTEEKLDKVMEHINGVDFKLIEIPGSIEISKTGIHHISAINNIKKRFEIVHTKVINKFEHNFYKIEIKAFDSRLYKVHSRTSNMLESNRGWIRKTSTMFPDDWSSDKIKLKIREAAENVRELPSKKTKGTFVQIGYTKEGIPLEFSGINGSNPSVYANFDYIR